MKQSCKTCKWSKLPRNSRGNFEKRGGECLYPVNLPSPIPPCVKITVSKVAVWTDDGVDCNCYERNTEVKC